MIKAIQNIDDWACLRDFPVSTRTTSLSVNSKSMMPLDVFTLHDVGGMLDTLMAEMFASTELGVFSG